MRKKSLSYMDDKLDADNEHVINVLRMIDLDWYITNLNIWILNLKK